ncbi:MAG TPA: FadR family transcriptional regulator [Oceanospirillaceae bacterium]|jgi:DNA-binding FadR family transcriptional regulator|nr:FadR family transcriptional regulator [Oceanospirillaceae bacterium]
MFPSTAPASYISLDRRQSKPNGARALATAISEAIQRQVYRANERLPAERDLAQHYDVSRGTLRSALSLLEQQGLVERKVGSGTFVRGQANSSSSQFADTTSPMQLMQVRNMLEPAIVDLAVHHAAGRDLEQLRTALERVEAARSAEQFSIADEAFHQAIAQACGNPLMIWIYEQVNEVRRHELWRASRGKVLTQENMTQYNAHHRALFEAISHRDAQTAKTTMTEHLSKAQQDLVR